MSGFLSAIFALFTPRSSAQHASLAQAENASSMLDHQNQEASRLTRELRELQASLTTARRDPAK